MARYAVINNLNKVINVIEWNGDPWTPPLGCSLVIGDGLNTGDTFVKSKNDATPPAIAAVPEINAWQQFTGAARLGVNV